MDVDDFVFILDVDGVLTDGKMYYTSEGKWMKAFGADDWDALKQINKYMPLCFITADKRGFPIVEKRIVDEMRFDLHLVSHEPVDRWKWMKEKYYNRNIIFMGDGIFDWFSLSQSFYGITTADALMHVKQCAKYITKRTGGNRAVAEACLHIGQELKLPWLANP